MDPQPNGDEDVDIELGRAWRDHRRHVLDVAFRILGSLADAEDAVQETFARLVTADMADIDDVGGWLVVVVSRVCFDRLRAERRRPTTSAGLFDDHPLPTTDDPADRVTLDDTIRIALHVMLERLSPAERTAFVLHDVFHYPFDSISEIVGRSPASCRQLASRARRVVNDSAARSRFVVESAEQRQVVDQFIAACATGNVQGLLEVLDPDVAGDADLGNGFTRVDVGRDVIAPQLVVYLGPDSNTMLLSLHTGGEAQVVALRERRIVALVTLAVAEQRISHIHALVDPAKLMPIADVLGG